MKNCKTFKIKKIHFLKIKLGEELVSALTSFCQKKKIEKGIVVGIGALKKAKFGYFDQRKKKFFQLEKKGPLEIVSLLGNISLKEKKSFLHIHIALADKKGNVFGGHLIEGIVFAGEMKILEIEGEKIERAFDSETGLFLWQI